MRVPAFRRVAGGWVQAWDRRQLIGWMLAQAREPGPRLVGNHNLHSLALLRRRPAMTGFYRRCDAVFIDGMPLVPLGIAQGHRLRRRHRHTVLDWLPDLARGCHDHGLRWMHIGSPPGVAERGMHGLAAACGLSALPEHAVIDGYFDADPERRDSQSVLERIGAFAPHVLTVGMGMPRQELWLMAAIDRMPTVGVVVTIGAALEYYAGVQAAPPRWVGQIGLEWLYRLATSPRRLAGRYLIEPWVLLPTLLGELARHRGEEAERHP